MKTYGGRYKVSRETYYGVPAGWRRDEMIRTHRELGGSYDIAGPEAAESGTPGCVPDRRHWLQYRATLYRIVDGVDAGDPACAEMAVRYIELHYIGSYSGYLRAPLARALSRVALSDGQVERLVRVFCSMVNTRDYPWEFAAYRKLWRRLAARAPAPLPGPGQ